jgi:hypothetical protein
MIDYPQQGGVSVTSKHGETEEQAPMNCLSGKKSRNSLALLIILLCGVSAAFGQRITGSIGGTVKDPQGAVVPTAAIKATNTETGFARNATAGADGVFLLQYLPVGNYTVEVTATGFKKYVERGIVVAVDQTNSLSVALAS